MFSKSSSYSLILNFNSSFILLLIDNSMSSPSINLVDKTLFIYIILPSLNNCFSSTNNMSFSFYIAAFAISTFIANLLSPVIYIILYLFIISYYKFSNSLYFSVPHILILMLYLFSNSFNSSNEFILSIMLLILFLSFMQKSFKDLSC